MSEPKRVPIVFNDTGEIGTVPENELLTNVQRGAVRLAKPDEIHKALIEKRYGDQGLLTFGESAIDTTTMGASSWAARKLGLTTQEAQSGRREANPGWKTAGELAGYAGALAFPEFLAARGATAAGAVAKGIGIVPRSISAAGKAATSAVERAMGSGAEKLAARALAHGVGGATEGALIGAANAVQEDLVGDSELTAEKLAAHVGLGALTGGALGASAPIVGAGARAVTSKAKDTAKKLLGRSGKLEDLAAAEAFQATLPNKRISGKLTNEDKIRMGRILREEGVVKGGDTVETIAQKSEAKMDEIGQQIGDLASTVDNIDRSIASRNQGAMKDWRKLVKQEIKKYRADKAAFETKDVANSEYVEGLDLGKRLKGLSDMFPERNAYLGTEDNVALSGSELASAMSRAKNTAKVVEPKTPELFRDFEMPARPELESRFAPKYQDVYKRIKTEVVDKLSASPFDKKLTDSIRSELRNFTEHYKRGDGRVGLGELFHDRIRLDKRINYEAAKMPQLSEELNKVRNILADEFKRYGDQAGKVEGINLSKDLMQLQEKYEAMVTAHKASFDAATRQAASVGSGFGMYDRLAGIGGAVAGLAAVPTAPALALGVGAAYASKFAREKGRAYLSDALDKLARMNAMDTAVRSVDMNIARSLAQSIGTANRMLSEAASGSLVTPHDSFFKRASEIKQLAADNQMLMDKVQKSTEKLAPAAPATSAMLGSVATRATQFLASKLPNENVKPWGIEQPSMSKTEKAKYMRYQRAVEDPMTLMEEIKSGRVNPETVEAVKNVYPRTYEFIQRVSQTLIASQPPQKLNRKKRISLSYALGSPYTQSMQPGFLSGVKGYATPAGPRQQAGGARTKPPSRGTIDKLIQENRTTSQRLAAK